MEFKYHGPGLEVGFNKTPEDMEAFSAICSVEGLTAFVDRHNRRILFGAGAEEEDIHKLIELGKCQLGEQAAPQPRKPRRQVMAMRLRVDERGRALL
jgi:hypothetical protein